MKEHPIRAVLRAIYRFLLTGFRAAKIPNASRAGDPARKVTRAVLLEERLDWGSEGFRATGPRRVTFAF